MFPRCVRSSGAFRLPLIDLLGLMAGKADVPKAAHYSHAHFVWHHAGAQDVLSLNDWVTISLYLRCRFGPDQEHNGTRQQQFSCVIAWHRAPRFAAPSSGACGSLGHSGRSMCVRVASCVSRSLQRQRAPNTGRRRPDFLGTLGRGHCRARRRAVAFHCRGSGFRAGSG